MAVMVKTSMEQNKAKKTQYDKSDIPGSSNLAKRPAEIQKQSSKINITEFNGSYFKVVRFGRPKV